MVIPDASLLPRYQPSLLTFMDDTQQFALLAGRLEARMDSQDRVLVEIRDHTKATNGRVTKLEAAKIAEDAVKDERERVAVEVKRLEDRRRARREWAVGTLVALVSVAASVATALALGA